MEQRGALFTAILDCAAGADIPELDPVTSMAFGFISAQLSRDAEKWKQTREERIEAGRKGGKASGQARKQKQANEANASKSKQDEANVNAAKQNEANEAVNVNVNVNGNVNSDSVMEGQPEAAEPTRTKRTAFKPPTLDEVTAYCRERGNGVDPQRFIDFYEARGWMLGKNKMKDWKAAVRTWESGSRDEPPSDKTFRFVN